LGSQFSELCGHSYQNKLSPQVFAGLIKFHTQPHIPEIKYYMKQVQMSYTVFTKLFFMYL